MPNPGEPHAAFRAYLAELQRNLASGIAKENTHRHALQDLLEALDSTLSVFNDPKHIDVGAPDFTLRRKGETVSRLRALFAGWSLPYYHPSSGS